MEAFCGKWRLDREGCEGEREFYEADGKTRCGLWLMKGDAVEGRKTEFTGMVKKTNVSTSEKRSIGPIELPALKGGKPYIASVATVDPGITGSFTISVTSVEDTDVMIVPLQEGPGGQAAKPLRVESRRGREGKVTH